MADSRLKHPDGFTGSPDLRENMTKPVPQISVLGIGFGKLVHGA